MKTNGIPTAHLSYIGQAPGGLTFKAGSNGTATISGKALKIARGKKFAITIAASSSAGSAKQTLTIQVR